MRGVVFTEYLSFVEQVAGAGIVDDMIDMADPPSGGAYTSVGHYEFSELACLIGALSTLLDTPAPKLITAFGEHLFGRFTDMYPQFFEGRTDGLAFLETIESHIHVEVRKLYPDAEPPSLDVRRIDAENLELRYASRRPLGALCIVLIQGCAVHFGERYHLNSAPTEDGLIIEIRRDLAKAA